MSPSYASEMKHVNSVAGHFGKDGIDAMLPVERRQRTAMSEEIRLGVARGPSLS